MKSILCFALFFYLIVVINGAPLNKNEAMEFLNEFDFINKDTNEEDGIKKYQNLFNLTETGKLDSSTLAFMNVKMCGRPDGVEIKNKERIWPKNHLTYKIQNDPVSGSLNKKNIEDELEKAFEIWTQHIPFSFEKNDEVYDINIRFIDPKKRKLNSDGHGKALAYAYYPVIGDIFFDAEDWSLDSSKGYNFRAVAAHEIGHSLGLGHSENKASLMYPYYKPYKAGWSLHSSDISRIKKLYGKDHVCQFGHIDGLFNHNDETTVVVKGQYCWKFKKNQIQDGYPKLCEKLWKNFPANVQAVFKSDEKIHFFAENQLFFYENSKKRKINLDNIFLKKIDTVLNIQDRLYIFEGENYWSFLKKNKTWTKKGDSRNIRDFWTGIPSDLDAAIYDNNKYIYFFKNSDVYTFNIDSKNAVKTPIKINEFFQC